jgi:uncharacterized protein
MTSTAFDRPRPAPTADSQPYWDGLRAHRLVFQRCARCKTPRHYPRPVCDRCFSMACDWVPASGRGRIHSWTVNHHAFHPAFKAETPYVTVTVDMDEGVRMQAPLIAADDLTLSIGLVVEVVYEDVSADLTLPRFRVCT